MALSAFTWVCSHHHCPRPELTFPKRNSISVKIFKNSLQVLEVRFNRSLSFWALLTALGTQTGGIRAAVAVAGGRSQLLQPPSLHTAHRRSLRCWKWGQESSRQSAVITGRHDQPLLPMKMVGACGPINVGRLSKLEKARRRTLSQSLEKNTALPTLLLAPRDPSGASDFQYSEKVTMLFFKSYLFIFDCTAIVAACGLSLVAASRGFSSCSAQASCDGFSFWSTGSMVHRLQ